MDNKQIILDNGNKIVERYQIIGTRMMIYAAWELTEGIHGKHSTIQHINGLWYGKIGTRRIDCKLPAFTKERSDYVMSEYDKQYNEAYKLITDNFPEASILSGHDSMGDIEVTF